MRPFICHMKLFFKRQKAFNLMVQLLATFVFFCCSSFGFSPVFRTGSWAEAEIVTRYMVKNNLDTVLLTSRSDSYPNFVNSARNYLGYEIVRAYASEQESFVCSSRDGNITPISFKNLESTPNLICLNGYGGDRESFVSHYGNLLYGNDIKSAELGIDKFYITQSLAKKIIGKENPQNDDYQKLMKNGVAVSMSKNGLCSEKKLDIVDIITDYKFGWMETLYGEDIIFGGFYCAEMSIVDNLMVHSILKNDNYSNAYFFSKAKFLLREKCSYICEYKLFENGILIGNTSLNESINNLNTSGRNMEIYFGCFFIFLLISLALFFIFLWKRGYLYFLKNNNGSFLIVSLSFAAAVFACSKINLLSFANFSLFSPFGFVFMFLLYALFIGFSLFCKTLKRDVPVHFYHV